jgi:hypothetical protein
MKTKLRRAVLALLSSFILHPPSLLHAASTIDAVNKYAYAANLGWVDWRGDTNSGAVIGEYVCSGLLYAANVGWISLGSGAPANQIQYQNSSATDFGVNQDGTGKLTGYAYGANIGWINFEQTYGRPRVDLLTGKLSGSVWSANCGWISLSNAVAFVQTGSIQKGALAPNGLPIAWLLQNFGVTNVDAHADADGDGVPNDGEYLADTDPNNDRDVLKITTYQRNVPIPDYNQIEWNSKPTRFYAVQSNPNLADSAGWLDCADFSSPGVSATGFYDYNPTNQFYRIRAYRPLMP